MHPVGQKSAQNPQKTHRSISITGRMLRQEPVSRHRSSSFASDHGPSNLKYLRSFIGAGLLETAFSFKQNFLQQPIENFRFQYKRMDTETSNRINRIQNMIYILVIS